MNRERQPEGIGRDDRGKGKMRRETVLAHADAVIHKAAHHHEPAQPSLRAAQDKQRRYLRDERFWDCPAQQKIDERQEEYNSDKAPQLPVRPFPPVNRLETFEAEALIHRLILPDLFVFLEGLLPRCVA